MKFISIVLLFTICSRSATAQRFDSLYVNLYTDSLKKGTYNYINIEGITNEGLVLPLDTNHISFLSDKGVFYGNSLWIDSACSADKITITVRLKSRKEPGKTFEIFIKKNEDPNELPTEEEIIRSPGKKRKNG